MDSTLEQVITKTAVSLTDILIKVGVAALICVVAKVFNYIIRRVLRKASIKHEKFTPLMCQFTTKVISVIVWICAAIGVLTVFGINMKPVIAGLGVTGVVLGFALQESIASLFSGMMLAINNPFRIGDYVEIGSTGGTIHSMDVMSITLTTPDNKKITMANKLVWGSVITNYSYTTRRRVDMVVPVAYGSDYQKAVNLIKDLLLSYPETLTDPLPTVEVAKLDDSSVNIIARPWVLPGDYWTVNWRFQSDILRVLKENNIEIPYNKIDINIRQMPKV